MVRAAAVMAAIVGLPRALRAGFWAAPSTKQTLRLREQRVDVQRDPARRGQSLCRACSKQVRQVCRAPGTAVPVPARSAPAIPPDRAAHGGSPGLRPEWTSGLHWGEPASYVLNVIPNATPRR